MRYIKELREGEMVTEVYLVKQCQILKAKTGKNYMSLTLQDRSGSLDAKAWDLGPAIANVDPLDFVKVEGQVTSFQNALQLNVRRLRKADEGEYDQADYIPTTDKDRKEMFKELKMCAYLADSYPILNRDLLLTAAIFHDIGKLSEISSFPENDYTDDGNLLGHIFLGAEFVGKKMEEIPHFPAGLASELRHCILAHHGELTFGSPKKPAIAEALALSMADNLDAKMECLKELFAGNDTEGAWLGYQKLFESNIRITSKQ